ncbi:MAG TPA: hypothetical protein VFU19_14100 [Iamia sp.]|nr:hypothetical protein [Iamia sp.]
MLPPDSRPAGTSRGGWEMVIVSVVFRGISSGCSMSMVRFCETTWSPTMGAWATQVSVSTDWVVTVSAPAGEAGADATVSARRSADATRSTIDLERL